MAKVRVRKLWIKLRFNIPDDVPYEKIIETLKRSIRRGDYQIPRSWHVIIEWRNSETAEMRRGEWKSEMTASAESSPGFDTVVTHYLEDQENV